MKEKKAAAFQRFSVFTYLTFFRFFAKFEKMFFAIKALNLRIWLFRSEDLSMLFQLLCLTFFFLLWNQLSGLSS